MTRLTTLPCHKATPTLDLGRVHARKHVCVMPVLNMTAVELLPTALTATATREIHAMPWPVVVCHCVRIRTPDVPKGRTMAALDYA